MLNWASAPWFTALDSAVQLLIWVTAPSSFPPLLSSVLLSSPLDAPAWWQKHCRSTVPPSVLSHFLNSPLSPHCFSSPSPRLSSLLPPASFTSLTPPHPLPLILLTPFFSYRLLSTSGLGCNAPLSSIHPAWPTLVFLDTTLCSVRAPPLWKRHALLKPHSLVFPCSCSLVSPVCVVHVRFLYICCNVCVYFCQRYDFVSYTRLLSGVSSHCVCVSHSLSLFRNMSCCWEPQSTV